MDPNLETELLHRYLDKEVHAFRQGEFDVQHRAVINGLIESGVFA